MTTAKRQPDESTVPGRASLPSLGWSGGKTATKPLSACLAVALAAMALYGCGGGQRGSDVVARVGAKEITHATLSHWTATFVRGDYYVVERKKAPTGLATNPPDYLACVEAAKTIRSPSATNAPFTAAQLDTKCHELYASVTQEALKYLISVLWSEGQATERGYKITDADIAERIAQTQKEDYPRPGQFASYLTNKGWSRADLSYIVKRNLLVGEVLKALEAEAGNKGLKGQLALARLVAGNARKWSFKTSCTPGFIVEQCKQYRGAQLKTKPAAVIFEEMVGVPQSQK